jgi:hypothetical protein
MEGRDMIKNIYCSPESTKFALGLLHPSVVFVVSSIGTRQSMRIQKPNLEVIT